MAHFPPSPRFWLRPWMKRLVVLLLLVVAWKVFWRFGPSWLGEPGPVFQVQARLLLKQGLGFPRRLEGVVPAPAWSTPAAGQLRLSGYWEAQVWTHKALSAGRVEGRQLHVRLGTLELLEVRAIGPLRWEEGREFCDLTCRLRWELPDSERDLFRVREVVGLKGPGVPGLQAPGQELERKFTLERRYGGWHVKDAEVLRPLLPGKGGDGKWARWVALGF